MYNLEFNQYVWEQELQVLQMQHFYLGIHFQTTFWLRQELKESLCLSVCLWQGAIGLSIFISLSGSQVFLRPFLGLSQVSLKSVSGLFQLS